MERKDEHLKLALIQKEGQNDFDNIRFVHNALHGASFSKLDLKTSFANLKLDLPIYINAMTGGTKKAEAINEKLAKLANHFSIPIATGSLSVLLNDDRNVDSFKVIRKYNPNGIVFANIGADKTLDQVNKIIDVLCPNLLQIHLNIPQEMVMPEGDRDFSKLEQNIKDIVQGIKIPVIVKEVGFGMSKSTIEKLKSLGVKTIDVSGSGGTNFIKIENARRFRQFEYLNEYGLSTVESLLEANTVSDVEILASGGIRNPYDVVKALALGARSVGMSKYFLELVVNNNYEDAINKFNEFIEDVKTIMTILGVSTIKDLKNLELIFSNSLINYIKQRNIANNILRSRN